MSDILDENRDDNFRNRLRNYKEEPDDALWQKISKGMHAMDIPLKEKLKHFEEQPDDAVWLNIRQSLTIHRFIYRVEWATYIFVTLLLSYFVYYNSTNDPREISLTSIEALAPRSLTEEENSFPFKNSNSIAEGFETSNIFPFANRDSLKRNEPLIEASNDSNRNIMNKAAQQKNIEYRFFSEDDTANDQDVPDHSLQNRKVSSERSRHQNSTEAKKKGEVALSSKIYQKSPAISGIEKPAQALDGDNPALLKYRKAEENDVSSNNADADSVIVVREINMPINDETDKLKNRITEDIPGADSIPIMTEQVAFTRAETSSRAVNRIGQSGDKPIEVAITHSTKAKTPPPFTEGMPSISSRDTLKRSGYDDINNRKDRELKDGDPQKLVSETISLTDSVSSIKKPKVPPFDVITLKEADEEAVKAEGSLKPVEAHGDVKQKVQNPEKLLFKQGTGLYLLLMPTLGYTNIQPRKDDDILIESIEHLSAFSPARLGMRLEIGYEKVINRRISINGGLLYFQRKQTIAYYYKDINKVKVTPVSGDSLNFDVDVLQQTGEFEYELKNLGILIGLNYTVDRQKFIHKAGLSAELHKGLVSPKIKTEKNNQLFLFGNLYYRISYPLGRRLDLMFQPTFNYALKLDEQVNAPFYVKPYGFGLNFGLFFSIR